MLPTVGQAGLPQLEHMASAQGFSYLSAPLLSSCVSELQFVIFHAWLLCRQNEIRYAEAQVLALEDRHLMNNSS